MPIYRYRCENGHEEDHLRSVAERDDVALCETCQKPQVPIPSTSFNGKVLGGTPTFYPGRKHK